MARKFHRRARNAVLWAASLFALSCGLPGIPFFPAGESDGGEPDFASSCPAVPTCGANETIVQCAEDGVSFEVVPCATGEICSDGICEDVTAGCEEDPARTFRLSRREIVFDVPELLADCQCSGPVGCNCPAVDYKTQRRQLLIENCASRQLFLQSAELSSTALRPDGEAVFQIESPSSYRNVVIQPGSELPIDIIYRPAPGVSQLAESRIDLDLIGTSVREPSIPIRTRSFCITATPRVRFETIIPGQVIERFVMLQNCGTEPLTLDGVDVRDWSGPGEPEVTVAEKELPFKLDGGEETRVRVKVRPEEAGKFGGRLSFDVAEAEAGSGTWTDVEGFAAFNSCSSLELPELQIASVGELHQGTFIDVAPGTLIRFAPRTLPPGQLPRFTLLDAPADYNADLLGSENVADLFATLVGQYRIRYEIFDTSEGLFSCDVEEFTITTIPDSPIYAELTWSATGDSIRGDEGFGRGVDVDLYVLSVNDQERLAWRDPDAACFPEAGLPCGVGMGDRISESRSGRTSAAYSFEESDGIFFQFAAYVRNPYNFAGVDVSIRVWHDGELVAPLNRSRFLNAANDFWVVGSWNQGVATVSDSYTSGIID